MRHLRYVGVLGVLAAGLAFVSTAGADKPAKFPLPAEPAFLPADICGFPVGLIPLQNNEWGKVFSNGVFKVTGVFKARLTNLTTGKSVVLNISGGGTLVPRPDGTILVNGHGPALIFFFPGQIAPGAPGALLLLHGQFSEVLDATGVPVPGTFRTAGNVQDACALVAG